MPRNFDRRYELFFPVRASKAKAAVLAELRAQVADDVNAFELALDGAEKALWQGEIDIQRADDHRRPAVPPDTEKPRARSGKPRAARARRSQRAG